MLELTVTKREAVGTKNLHALRGEGVMPAVLYGRKEKSTPITVPADAFKKVYREAGESSVVTLIGLSDAKEALIHDVDVHPLTGEPRHADFYVIEKGKKVRVGIPLEFTGTAPAVKELGGTLVKVLHELEIEALPRDLPHEIMVDVSSLTDFESRVTAQDVALPEGASLVTDPGEVVALVSEVVEEEEAPAMSMEDIEVEQKGKKEGETGESAPAEESSQ